MSHIPKAQFRERKREEIDAIKYLRMRTERWLTARHHVKPLTCNKSSPKISKLGTSIFPISQSRQLRPKKVK